MFVYVLVEISDSNLRCAANELKCILLPKCKASLCDYYVVLYLPQLRDCWSVQVCNSLLELYLTPCGEAGKIQKEKAFELLKNANVRQQQSLMSVIEGVLMLSCYRQSMKSNTLSC